MSFVLTDEELIELIDDEDLILRTAKGILDAGDLEAVVTVLTIEADNLRVGGCVASAAALERVLQVLR